MAMLKTMALLLRRGASRMISSSSGGGGVRSPWMMLSPVRDRTNGATIFRFWCCAEDKRYSFFDNKQKSRGGQNLIDWEYAYWKHMSVIGSSQGWLAYKYNFSLYLIDPVTFHCMHLPPWYTPQLRDVKPLILDHTQQKAFIISDSVHALAFCWTHRRNQEWTLFGGSSGSLEAEVYETMVYSTIHRRLFCITSNLRLEAWDVQGESPKLVWASLCDTPQPDRDRLSAVRRGFSRVKYLACEEQSGDLFLVVRNFIVETGEPVSHRDPTVDFDVYKIDPLLMKIKLMKDSLEGVSIFVGCNHPVAIKHVAGLKPDSVYFTYDDRIRVSSYLGVFDYGKRLKYRLRPCPRSDHYPLWFTPALYNIPM